MNYKEQQARTAYTEFVAALKEMGAELKATEANGVTLRLELSRRGLSPSKENLLQVTNEILFENKLEWVKPPAKLASRKTHEAVRNQNVVAKEGDFAARKTALEAEKKKKKDDEELVKRTYSLVSNYLPVDARSGRILYSKQGAT
jgi:hypothetical protein